MKCEECGKEFKNIGGHLRAHKMTKADYYHKHFPRYNLWNDNLIPFKNENQYFKQLFTNKNQMVNWVEKNKGDQKAKEIMLSSLQERIKDKELEFAPTSVELDSTKYLFPTHLYDKMFGSYTEACRLINFEPLLSQEKLPVIEPDWSMRIQIDTREKAAWFFPNAFVSKLDFGDYTAVGDRFTNTFVDRKSLSDFWNTFSQGTERFEKEIERAIFFNSHLFVVVESPLEKAKAFSYMGKKKNTFPFIWHNINTFTNKYRGHFQVVFADNKKRAALFCLLILQYGKEIWGRDANYLLNNVD